MRDPIPLCVDLDGTLITSDSMTCGIRQFVSNRSLNVVLVFRWLFQGRAFLKQQIAERVTTDPVTLRYNQPLLAYLANERSQGRQLVLCTGADMQVANAVAKHLRIFSLICASDGKRNFTGRTKANWLTGRFGVHGFDYVANSWADIVVWRQARFAMRVNASVLTLLAPKVLRTKIVTCTT